VQKKNNKHTSPPAASKGESEDGPNVCRVKGALQLLMNRYGSIRFAQVHELSEFAHNGSLVAAGHL